MTTWQQILSAVFALASLNIYAENWGQWRGPNFNGSTTEKNLPAKFSKTENVAWSVPLPGPSAATPAIWGDRVFISSADKAAQNLQALCLDRRTGKTLWKQTVAQGYRRDDRSNYSSPSPATDGERVIFFYGNGELVAFDLEGKQ